MMGDDTMKHAWCLSTTHIWWYLPVGMAICYMWTQGPTRILRGLVPLSAAANLVTPISVGQAALVLLAPHNCSSLFIPQGVLWIQ